MQCSDLKTLIAAVIVLQFRFHLFVAGGRVNADSLETGKRTAGLLQLYIDLSSLKSVELHRRLSFKTLENNKYYVLYTGITQLYFQ